MTYPLTLLGAIDGGLLRGLRDWIAAIPLEDWPQQSKIDQRPRPAMVNDLSWKDFGARTDALVSSLNSGRTTNRMLSVVMPGHSIPPHADRQPPNWLSRVHVPLFSNDDAELTIGGEIYVLEVGFAYLVDVRVEHSIANHGATPRIHFMFDEVN